MLVFSNLSIQLLMPRPGGGPTADCDFCSPAGPASRFAPQREPSGQTRRRREEQSSHQRGRWQRPLEDDDEPCGAHSQEHPRAARGLPYLSSQPELGSSAQGLHRPGLRHPGHQVPHQIETPQQSCVFRVGSGQTHLGIVGVGWVRAGCIRSRRAPECGGGG